MKNIILYCIIPFTLLSSCQSGNGPKTSDELIIKEIPVTLAKPQEANSNNIIQSSGLLTTKEETKHGFKIGGIINELYVDEGDYVKKGQLLAILKLDEVEAQIKQAKLSADKANRDLERVNNLYQDSIATLEQLQDSQTQFDVAQEVIKQIQYNMDNAGIYARNAGFVTQKLGNVGEVISAGVPILITNDANRSNGWIMIANVTDQQWALINEGDRADIVLDAYPGVVYSGKVDKKSLVADPRSGAFNIEIDIKSSGESLAIGMFGKVKIHSQLINTYVMIPHQALVEANGNEGFVFVPNKNKSVLKKAIKIKEFSESGVLVDSGLEVDEEVVISNSPFLTENSSIQIIR